MFSQIKLSSLPVDPSAESATRVTSKESSSRRNLPKERSMSKILRVEPAPSPPSGTDKEPILILLDFST